MTHFTHADRLTDLIYAGAVCPECRKRSHAVDKHWTQPPQYYCSTCWKVFEAVEGDAPPAADVQDERFAEMMEGPRE